MIRSIATRTALFVSLVALLPGVVLAQEGRPKTAAPRALTLRHTCHQVMVGVELDVPEWSPDGKALILKLGKWVDPATGREVEPGSLPKKKPELQIVDGELVLGRRKLTSDGVAKREAHLSADRSRVSFVKEHNLHILDVTDEKEWAVSKDGAKLLLYGYLDWVYQEELRHA